MMKTRFVVAALMLLVVALPALGKTFNVFTLSEIEGGMQ